MMKSDVLLRCLLAVALVAGVGNAGCAGKKTHLHAEAVAAGGIRVSPSDVFSNSSVLVVKVNVVNEAGSPIVLDTDAARLTASYSEPIKRWSARPAPNSNSYGSDFSKHSIGRASDVC